VRSLTLDDVRRALRARTPARLPEPLPRQSAVAMVLREGAPGLEALLIRRADRPGDPWSGQVAFPGGRAEPGESLLETAVRETAEEVGLDLGSGAELLGGLDEIQAIGRGRLLGLSIQPWVFGLVREPDPPRLSGEVASAHWVRVPDLLDPARQAPFAYEHEGLQLELPSLRVGGLVIWGLTYRMLSAFAEVLAAGESR
jgi:8-oxo-dGTP pyrophosphatase MutT (NUDIX family)